ncbi:MAG: hypothetical protein J6S36_03640 [Eggerthellaceae bacterium]|nr:hypothetical protein [Eggerthellaceae bacterium]
MADEQVGTGYVLIKPKLDEAAKADMEKSGQGSGHGFGMAWQVAAGNIISGAVTQLAGAAVDVFANAFGNYADYEQLVGGVDTLFKESSSIVQENAAQAFKTAGLSANEYMEQVTSFSASLLQGLGGDTEAAAAYADMAIRDMSDNANKMGTDMGRITDAYQGFAKQNYTMLDNLKLGYGGTKKEMECLLADASEIAGVEFDIDNYNDVIEAIHVMQVEMDIAGTTSKEATETISGSISKLQSSWQNFLTGIMDENADVGALGDQLFESVGDVLKNVVPRIGVLVGRMFSELPDALVEAIGSVPSILEPLITRVFGEELGGEINEQVGGAFSRMLDVVKPVMETVKNVMSGAVELISKVFQTAWPFISGLVDTAMTAIEGIVSYVWPVVEAIVTGVIDDITNVIEGLAPLVQFVSGIFDEIQRAMSNPIEYAKNLIGGIIDTIKGFFNFSIQWPHVPLPHFAVNPPGWQIGDLLKGSIPSLGIDWYAQGGIVDSPTLIGAGEAGAEAIIPLSGNYMLPFAKAIASEMGGGNYITVNLNYEAGEDAQTLARDLARELGNLMGMEG